jgi:hypothetical protein
MRLRKSGQHCCFAILLAAVLFLSVAMSLAAQLPTGTFLGVVKDASGAVVPGATVTVQSAETNQTRQAQTDSGGAYRIPALPVGHYSIRVEHGGFKTETQTGLNLEVGQEAVVDFALEVGTTEQSVQVTGEAQQVNTTNSTLGSVVSEQVIADLPLNGRNYNDLTLLQPGITQQKNLSNSGGKQPGTVYSSNGAGYQSNSYMLDGASLISLYAVSAASGTGNTLGVDGIREYKVVTNNLGAEYGMAMGAQTVLVSKSGTNNFHGDGFEFLRNSALDADNYFDTPQSSGTHADGSPRRIPEFRRNNFGGSLGGPVQKNKTFFHAAYEGLRESIGQTIVSGTIPADCLPPTATQTNDPCATSSNKTVNNAVWQIVKLFPAPNLPAGCTTQTIASGITKACQYTYPSTEPVTENWGQGRLDHTFSSSDSVFGRYTFDDSYFQFGLGYKPFIQSEPTRSQFTTLSENHIFSPTLLNTVRFSYSRTAAHINSPSDMPPFNFNILPGQVVPGMGTFQITGITTSTQGGGFGPTNTLPTYATQNIFTWSDDLFWEKGKHSFKFGTLINYYQQDIYNQNPARGAFTDSSLAQFLSGTLNTVQGDVVPAPQDAFRHFRFETFGFYVQDDYKVRPNLTLNLGLRYEFATVETDRDGRTNSSTPTCTYPCFQIGPLFKNPYLHNFGPRVGFAWDVFGNGKTSLRGGGGLLYDVATLAEEITGNVGTTPPFGGAINLGATPFATIPIALGTANSLAENNPTAGLAYNLKAPKMYEWNLTAERQLPWSMALELSYVGSRGIHLLQSSDSNPWPFTLVNGQPFWPAYLPSTGGTGATPTGPCSPVCRLVNPSFGAFGVTNGTGDSIYHALEVTVTKRLTRGFQFQSSYTYSKLIDDGDGVAPSQATATSNETISLLDERLDRGLASYDVRNNYRFNLIYNLPAINSSNRFVRGLANGWWTATILAAQDGYPLTPSVSTNRSRSRTASTTASTNLDRPDWAPGRNPYNATHGVSSGCTEGTAPNTVPIAAGTPLGTPNLYFDPCAFVLAPVGYEGNVGRNSVIGPGLLNLDYSLVKDTSVKWLGEAGKIQFRAELFNIMNHPNFGQPAGRTVFSGSLADGVNCPLTGCPANTENPTTLVGVIQSTANGTTAAQSAGNSRQIQFGMKIIF